MLNVFFLYKILFIFFYRLFFFSNINFFYKNLIYMQDFFYYSKLKKNKGLFSRFFKLKNFSQIYNLNLFKIPKFFFIYFSFIFLRKFEEGFFFFFIYLVFLVFFTLIFFIFFFSNNNFTYCYALSTNNYFFLKNTRRTNCGIFFDNNYNAGFDALNDLLSLYFYNFIFLL